MSLLHVTMPDFEAMASGLLVRDVLPRLADTYRRLVTELEDDPDDPWVSIGALEDATIAVAAVRALQRRLGAWLAPMLLEAADALEQLVQVLQQDGWELSAHERSRIQQRANALQARAEVPPILAVLDTGSVSAEGLTELARDLVQALFPDKGTPLLRTGRERDARLVTLAALLALVRIVAPTEPRAPGLTLVQVDRALRRALP